ncbi:MAG: UDP-2,3-diacylglucosamine diphosphatase [Bacteroidia bacterium]
MENSKIYFASDFHLGVPSYEESRLREKRICDWLDSIKNDAKEIFLVGDIFDFWFEHKYTIPKYHTRFIGKIAELTDSGIKVHFFIGNHDMWMFDYFEKELGVTIYQNPIIREFNGKKFFIGHGDGLGPGDNKYKFIKSLFRNKFCQWMFARLHPNLSFGIANFFSKRSRLATGQSDEVFKGEDEEWLIQFCKDYLKNDKIDFFIFGHRHLCLDIDLGNNSRYINLGHWMKSGQYAFFDNNILKIIKL